ncbi:hypothetical protein BH09MYX1_BH09MYX1_13850 [soil metagenome]
MQITDAKVVTPAGQMCDPLGAMPRAISAFVVASSFVLAAVVACGGPAKDPVTPPSPSASADAAAPPSPDAGAPDAATSLPTQSVVRFDDLGVSYAVPNGYRVLGDDTLAAQVRAAANPRLVAALEKRGPQKKGIPLLALAKETTERGDGLSITISVTLVPKDATATEVLAEQRKAMGDNLETFSVVEDPTERVADGVKGTEIGVKYILRANGEARRMASFLRIFVREGVAYLAVAVFPESSGRGEEARLVLDGLHFYPPQP